MRPSSRRRTPSPLVPRASLCLQTQAVTSSAFTQTVIQEAALVWLNGLGDAILCQSQIAAEKPAADGGDPGEREVVLVVT